MCYVRRLQQCAHAHTTLSWSIPRRDAHVQQQPLRGGIGALVWRSAGTRPTYCGGLQAGRVQRRLFAFERWLKTKVKINRAPRHMAEPSASALGRGRQERKQEMTFGDHHVAKLHKLKINTDEARTALIQPQGTVASAEAGNKGCTSTLEPWQMLSAVSTLRLPIKGNASMQLIWPRTLHAIARAQEISGS